MSKLQTAALLIILISFFLHIKKLRSTPQYLKSLFISGKMTSGRAYSLDYLRLIATLFAIALHALKTAAEGAETGNSGFINLFTMIFLTCNTLFIMNSGALILRGKDESLLTFYSKRFSRVAIPLFCYYSIYILLSTRFFNEGFLHGVKMSVYQMISGPIDWTPHFWLIYVILSLYILAPFFKVLVRNLSEPMLHGLAVLIIVFQCFNVFLPFLGISQGFSLMIRGWEGVFFLGYYFTSPAGRKHTALFTGLGIIAFIGSAICLYTVPGYETILYAEGSPVMILLAGTMILLFTAAEKKLPKPKAVMNFFIKYSYSILLVHWAVLYFVRNSSFITRAGFGVIGNAVVSFIATLLLSAICAFVFDNTVVFCFQTLWEGMTGFIYTLKKKGN